MHLGAGVNLYALFALAFFASFIGKTHASMGDHLPDFKECVKVRQIDKPPQNSLTSVGLYHGKLSKWQFSATYVPPSPVKPSPLPLC